MFFLLFFLSSSEIEYDIKNSFFFFGYFFELIVENNIVIFQAVDTFKMNVHSIPSDLFQLFS